MAELERKYIIPLRKEWLKVPIYKRTKKSITAVREFLQQHMKTEDVRIGRYLNQAIWARGMKRPPHKVDVTAKKVEDKEGNYVTVELTNAPKEEKKEEPKKTKITDRIKEAIKAPEDKEAEKKAEEQKEEKKLLKKEMGEKESRAHAPKFKKEGSWNTAKDHQKEIYGHTGKPKGGVETTGQN